MANLTESDAAHVEFIKMTKVAVATAIIKSKPGDMTGEQYARFLHQKIQSDRDKWENKCKELESELLQIKIKLISNNQKEQQELRLNNTEEIPSYLSTTPPSSSDKVIRENESTTQEKTLHSHATFLENVSALKFTANFLDKVIISQIGKSNDCSDISDDMMQARIINQQTAKSVDEIIKTIEQTTSGKHSLISTETLVYSVDCIVRLLISFENYILSSGDDERALNIAATIVEKCCNLSLDLQAFIMGSTDINSYKYQNICCELLAYLSECPSLCSSIVRQLVQGIVAVSLHLKNSEDEEESPEQPPTHILSENVCYLFKTLDAILNCLLSSIEKDTVTKASARNRQHKITKDSEHNIAVDSQSFLSMNTETQTNDAVSVEEPVKELEVPKKRKQKRTKKGQKLSKKLKMTGQNATGNIIDFFNSVKSSQTAKPINTQNSENIENSNTAQQETANTGESTNVRQTRQVARHRIELSNLHSIITPDFICFIQEAMDDALLHTCDIFPLFSYYAWKISDVVTQIVDCFDKYFCV